MEVLQSDGWLLSGWKKTGKKGEEQIETDQDLPTASADRVTADGSGRRCEGLLASAPPG